MRIDEFDKCVIMTLARECIHCFSNYQIKYQEIKNKNKILKILSLHVKQTAVMFVYKKNY